VIYEKFDRLSDNETDKRTVKALIGMSKEHFRKLSSAFGIAYHAIQQERYESGEIKNLPKGGVPGCLDTFEKKLFFTLHYLKTYCTFDVFGFHFELSPGHAHHHIERFLPVLHRALADLNVLPQRAVATVEDLKQLIDKYDNIMIDGVECPCVRPQDDEKQKARYSGKKCRHTLKSLVIASANKTILFLSCIVAGSIHDYKLLKQLFDPKLPWFDKIPVWMDLGFLGANQDYGCRAKVHLPFKKPRKSKNNPNPELTAEQKRHNRKHAQIRVPVEHAIGGIKSFHCLTHRIRNHLETFFDYFFCLSAGLWNFKIA
jgi:hypothetical protein